jgi:hypothetical protein
MLTGSIVAVVNREPKTGTGKNGKPYTMLPLHRKVQFGDRTFDKYYSGVFNWGQAVKDAARCQVGDTVAVSFDDVQADVYESQGKHKAGIKLNGVSCVAITGSATQPQKRAEPTEEQLANTGGGAGDPDVPFLPFHDCAS